MNGFSWQMTRTVNIDTAVHTLRNKGKTIVGIWQVLEGPRCIRTPIVELQMVLYGSYIDCLSQLWQQLIKLLNVETPL